MKLKNGERTYGQSLGQVMSTAFSHPACSSFASAQGRVSSILVAALKDIPEFGHCVRNASTSIFSRIFLTPSSSSSPRSASSAASSEKSSLPVSPPRRRNHLLVMAMVRL